MAETRGVWGIDIGQAGLKAIRLKYAEAADQVLAVAFDYVPHPKILSQPDAIPEELIAQALEKFLSRNDLKGDAVVISVPGQTALARFIQLPPVEASKVGDIVKYEARQQIPFALEDVIWDYQTLGGGTEESGFMLEAEVGLFAMKRDDVFRHLKPFTNAKVEVDIIQIAPLALYNYLSFDKLGIKAGEETPDKDQYYIILDMGADNTTLLVSNGEKIWIRNVPIGGNHFTRALTKEMKLTFAKAEHLKCNATKSPDPRAVFQALRPVFNDYVSEIQRSIGYFSSVNRDAKIAKVIGLGNGFKLAGLQKFLQQNLQYEVEKIDSFQNAVGDAVLNAPLFQENILSFAVPYGLALQGLEQTRIHTTLLPTEIANARKIRRKKPWAALTAATLLFGLALTAVGYANAYRAVGPERWGDLGGGDSSSAVGKATALANEAQNYKSQYESAKGTNKTLLDQGQQLVSNLDTREYWLELYKAINECLPRDVADQLDETDITKKQRIKISSITAQRIPDAGAWFNALPSQKKEFMTADDKKPENAPKEAGYLVTLEGAHFHKGSNPRTDQGVMYVVTTLLHNLQQWEVNRDGSAFPVRKMGITHPTIVDFDTTTLKIYPPEAAPANQANPGFAPGGRGFADPRSGLPRNLPVPPGGNNPEGAAAKPKEIPKTSFVLQFIWKPTPHEQRADQPPNAAGTPEGGAPTEAPASPETPPSA